MTLHISVHFSLFWRQMQSLESQVLGQVHASSSRMASGTGWTLTQSIARISWSTCILIFQPLWVGSGDCGLPARQRRHTLPSLRVCSMGVFQQAVLAGRQLVRFNISMFFAQNNWYLSSLTPDAGCFGAYNWHVRFSN